MSVKGKISSIQSMGTLDGPGIRYVVFLQGCNLRCGCCHNPETQSFEGGTEYTAEEIVGKAERFKAYFGNEGGITLSGGEPILQPEFSAEIFALSKENGINTCLDTSGSLLNDGIKKLLSLTDRVLLDIKYPTDELYKKYAGCSIEAPLNFLKYLNGQGIPTTLRQVIIPTLNDTDENIEFLKGIIKKHPCIDKTELLSFKKICKAKYDNMGIAFPFEGIPTPSAKLMEELQSKL
ncbi:MAG: pyruvate formate lyase-activating protein [Clostridia bacterium]|nr:pyruvate formate lyase-activating protein [Clostridia bacterium]